MPTTLEALIVMAIALLPGATFVWALERVTGKWEFGLSDRLLRFVVFSAMIHTPAFPLTAWLVQLYMLESKVSLTRGAVFVFWGALVVYTFGPALLGSAVGRGARRRRVWSEWFTGRDPAPRAWDNLFLLEGQTGWVLLKLKSGPWIGGAWIDDEERGLRSFAGGYPYPADIYLAETAEVDPDDGSFDSMTGVSPSCAVVGLSSAGTRWSTLSSQGGERSHGQVEAEAAPGSEAWRRLQRREEADLAAEAPAEGACAWCEAK